MRKKWSWNRKGKNKVSVTTLAELSGGVEKQLPSEAEGGAEGIQPMLTEF